MRINGAIIAHRKAVGGDVVASDERTTFEIKLFTFFLTQRFLQRGLMVLALRSNSFVKLGTVLQSSFRGRRPVCRGLLPTLSAREGTPLQKVGK